MKQPQNGNHIFISYRRDAASAARAVQGELQNRGYSTFLDVDDFNSPGAFPRHIAQSVRNATDVVVILEKGALDRAMADPTFNDPDWMREEFNLAFDEDINVVPLFHEGFECPPESEQPRDIRRLLKRQGINVAHHMWSESFDRLEVMLKAEREPSTELSPDQPEEPPRRVRRTWLAALILSVIAVMLFLIFLEGFAPSPPLKLEWNLIAQRKLPDGAVDPFPIADGATLRSGDQMRILVRVNYPCHLYVVNEGPDGRIVGLYPNVQAGQQSYTVADQLIALPDDEDLWFQFDEETGEETVYIIASGSPVLELEHLETATIDESQKLRAAIQTRGFGQALSHQDINVRTTLGSGKSVAVPLETIIAENGNAVAKISFTHEPSFSVDVP